MDTRRDQRKQDAKHSIRCEQCGNDQTLRVEPEPSPLFLLWRNSVLKFYRESTGCRNHYLINNAKGRKFLLAMLVMLMSDSDAQQIAPWITPHELHAMRRRASHIKPTTINISRIIGLTAAQRDKHGWRVKNGKRVKCGILTFPACDETPDQEERRQSAAKNAARKLTRQRRKAELAAQARDPREGALFEVTDLITQRPGATVCDTRIIMDAMSPAQREVFPQRDDSCRRAINRMRKNLRLRDAARSTQRFETTPFQPKPLISQGLAGTNRGSLQGRVPQTDTTDVEAQLRAQVERLRQELDRRDAVIIRKGASNA
jgi:hypothetical protein